MKKNKKLEENSKIQLKVEQEVKANIKKNVSKYNSEQRLIMKDILINFYESIEQTSNRRILINSGFYLVILSLLLTNLFKISPGYISIIISIMGLIISSVWTHGIRIHKHLNEAKFSVAKMVSDSLLGLSLYDLEYEIYESKRIKCKSVAKLELIISFSFVIYFCVEILLSIIALLA